MKLIRVKKKDAKKCDLDSFNVKAAKNLIGDAVNSIATAAEKLKLVHRNLDNWTTEERKAITPYMKNLENMIGVMDVYKKSIENWIK